MRSPHAVPELPRLSPGIQLLEAPTRAIGPLHTLVLDTIMADGGEAVWIDAHNHGTSVYLAEVAPSPRLLERVHIARGFTPYQHQSLVADAVEAVTEATSVVVAPAFDALYREDDVRGNEPTEMLLRSLSRLAGYAREGEIPVLMTRVATDGFSAPIEHAARDTIEVEQTDFGPRFVGTDFETLVYHSNSQTFQTTLTYWARILRARQPLHKRSASQTAASTHS
mgnify:CR=1 FL=1